MIFKTFQIGAIFSAFAFLRNDSRKNKKYVKLNVLTNQLFDLKIASTCSPLSDFVSSSVESHIDFKAIILGYDKVKNVNKPY